MADTAATDTPAPLDLDGIDEQDFVNAIASAPDEHLQQLMESGLRKQILDEIFGRMADHINTDRAKGHDAVVHFKILDRPDGGYDHYEVVLKDGEGTFTDEPKQDPRLTLRVGPVNFLKLITGKSAGPVMFLSGKLKIEGDVVFAAQLMGYFNIPRAH